MELQQCAQLHESENVLDHYHDKFVHLSENAAQCIAQQSNRMTRVSANGSDAGEVVLEIGTLFKLSSSALNAIVG